MNKISIRGTLWIASDIHLGENVPRTAQAFYEFLARARRDADALILCGDIFDAWIGDDHALRRPPAWLAQAIEQLRATAQAIPLWLAHGNRDFLMGPALVQALGARLLTAPTHLDTDAGNILLAHGDEYCTDDVHYQRFRRVVHTPWVQSVFLALPLGLRRAIARGARARSRQARYRKTLRIMDVQPQAIERALREAGCTQMIHGHTHRPAVHDILVDGRAARRYVLPDWECDQADPVRGGWIEVDARGIRLIAQVPPRDPPD
ncbi:MAG: UDP-2,3-diacylglucosamine diphosphatase [Castellaniella sp.]|uniref:UDP-2,3-diacylglucosamine diphosphatase n=1 Tax=Castellaniella sp. TaxID=1955812 RepID=UPI00120743CC|nr:UDP-2,3-diacylglucosamine diphosphatase [Castellaniella sp.]TAN30168.1 MAG: UDP-2,3-diacylglucosamine diphosphatase [Castellaniella sp.]